VGINNCEVCRIGGESKKYKQNYWWKLEAEIPFGDIRVDGRVILYWILKI
jgi:hypothetical protein